MATVLCLGGGLLLAAPAHAESWRFAVIGDTPYSDYERRELPRLLDDIAAENVELIVHAGDIKNARARCDDELYRDRRALFDESAVPLVYVPGDNEWTDCRQLLAGHFEPLERLQKLREIFFAAPRSLGKRTLAVERQVAYPEHQRWRLGPVLFVTLNVPGPDNHWGMGRAPRAEFLTRNPRLLDWLREGFAIARNEELAGMVIVMQANPGFKQYMIGLGHPGFSELLATLTRETSAFRGQVLLVHGDTHWQRIDHPLYDPGTHRPIANFTRLESFGYPFLGWVKVLVDSGLPTLFRFEVRPYAPRH